MERPPLRHALRALGPGLVAGASDTDPTTVAAVAQLSEFNEVTLVGTLPVG